MPVGMRRIRTVGGLANKRGGLHRYAKTRWLVAAGATLGVALLPWTGTLRLDLWGGDHRWLGESVGLIDGLKAFAFPFLGVNIAIILATRFIGRYLCGYVCPVGAVARVDEWLRFRFRGNRVMRSGGDLGVLAICAALAFIALSFWTDVRVLVEGSALAAGIAWTALVATTAGFYMITHGLGLRFCREWCPSGVYFAVLGPNSATGVEFRNAEACTDCGACEAVCPVDLKPRDMLGDHPPREGMGLYPEGMTDLALCLRCGDCVAACEETTSRSDETPLALGFLSRDGQAAQAARTEEDAS